MPLNTLYHSMAIYYSALRQRYLFQVALPMNINHYYKLRVNIFRATDLF